MDRQILTESLKMNLRKLNLDEFARLFINEPMAIEEFYKLCNGVSAGKTISLLFNPHRLDTGTEKDSRSVFESLQDDNLISGLARLYLYNLEHGYNNAFYSAIQRGYQNIQYVNEFPPIVARIIYSEFGKNRPLRILDPCAGWGGRMLGAASLSGSESIYYTACEPSSKTFAGLSKLGAWLTTLVPSFKFELYNVPYEDFESESEFDIALTSPPYYDTEHYSDEDTNSLNRYATFNDWVTGFYEPLILNTIKRLTDNGVFILNVGDRKYQLSATLFDICNAHFLQCERINDYLSGNGDGKEKFYCISRQRVITKKRKLF